MASSQRGYVPVDTTTIPTTQRRFSAFNTCIHSGLDKWRSMLNFRPYHPHLPSFRIRQAGHKVHFRRHSSLYSSPATPSTSSPDHSITYRRSCSAAVPLKPILKSSAAYRHSLQSSRTAPSISTRRRSNSHDIRVVPASTISRHSISATRRSFSVRRLPLSTSQCSTSGPRSSFSTSSHSINSPNFLDLALIDTQDVAYNLLTMSAAPFVQSVQGVQASISTFKKHLAHLSHRLTILNEAEAEQAEARGRQVDLQQKYLDAVDRQSEVMNELALGAGREVDGVRCMRSGVRWYDGYPSPAKSDDTGSDVESFLGRKIAFEPEDQRMGREIDVMDVSLRHTSIRNELEVLTAQMALETLERLKVFKGFQKMSRDLKDEICLVAKDRDCVLKLARRHGGRSERKEMEEAVKRFKTVREGFLKRSERIGEEWLVMDGRDFFKR